MEKAALRALLLRYLTSPDDEGTRRELSRFGEPEWEEFAVEAHGQALSPLLYHLLKTAPEKASVPAKLMSRLRASFLHTAAQNTAWLASLDEVLRRFDSGEVPVILLKGAYLCRAAYVNPGLRPMADLDLLVREKDLEAASLALRECGYACDARYAGAAREHLPPFRRKGSPDIELHFSLAPPPWRERIDVEGLFARSVPGGAPGSAARALCPEDILLHLGMHYCLHHEFDNGIKPLVDIRKALDAAGSPVRWDAVAERSGLWGLDRAMFLVFSLAARYAGAAIPAGVLASPGSGGEDVAMLALAESLVFGARPDEAPRTAFPFWGGSFGERAARAWKRLFPPRADMRREMSGSGKPLALLYMKRLAGLARRHAGPMAAALLRRESRAGGLARADPAADQASDPARAHRAAADGRARLASWMDGKPPAR